jgi:hypothetical protein
MSWFGSKPKADPKQVVREQKRAVNASQRDLDRQLRELDRQETQTKAEIKKLAAKGQTGNYSTVICE